MVKNQKRHKGTDMDREKIVEMLIDVKEEEQGPEEAADAILALHNSAVAEKDKRIEGLQKAHNYNIDRIAELEKELAEARGKLNIIQKTINIENAEETTKISMIHGWFKAWKVKG
jgi:BioD-like phosphotransacetylase family protein